MAIFSVADCDDEEAILTPEEEKEIEEYENMTRTWTIDEESGEPMIILLPGASNKQDEQDDKNISTKMKRKVMRKCEYCNQLYKDEFKWCPLCGNETSIIEVSPKEIRDFIAIVFEELVSDIPMTLKTIKRIRGLFLGMTFSILKCRYEDADKIIVPLLHAYRLEDKSDVFDDLVKDKQNNCTPQVKYGIKVYRLEDKISNSLINRFSEALDDNTCCELDYNEYFLKYYIDKLVELCAGINQEMETLNKDFSDYMIVPKSKEKGYQWIDQEVSEEFDEENELPF